MDSHWCSRVQFHGCLILISFGVNEIIKNWNYYCCAQVETQLSFLESVAEEEEGEGKQKRVQIDIDDSGRMSEIKEQSEQQAEDRKSVNSTRMPSTITRARLVRTPANKDDVPTVPSPEPAESGEPHTPDILITELKNQPEVEEGDEDEESDIEPEYKQVTVETVNAEEDWDTDLEIEGKLNS